MKPQRIAVLDIGKTHARLQLIDAPSGEVLWRSDRDSRSVQGPLTRELDVAGIDAWLFDSLAALPGRDRVGAIVPVAHGAAAVLVDAAGAVLAAPDYEDTVFDEVALDYRPHRDPFDRTCSPFLPLGLNLGRQWFLLQQRAPELFARVHHALLYPQYWAWRLSGVAASEVTSLGCHTDLWLPESAQFSALAQRRGWTRLLPPLHRAGAVLGSLTNAVAARIGLPADCRIYCGLHDSNASFLCHLGDACDESPFAVISSGTWTVVMARGADLHRLDESRDMLANVDAQGRPVATARFMGGREYAAIAGPEGLRATPTLEDVRRLVDQSVMALPSFSQGGGPFPGSNGHVLCSRTLIPAERAALSTLYVALMCTDRLAALGASGPVLLDGPLASDPLFPALLAALWPTAAVHVPAQAAGAAQAARILCGYPGDGRGPAVRAADIPPDALRRYAAAWRQLTTTLAPA